MHPNVVMFLDARAQARAVGDVALERSLTADLRRIGYTEPLLRVVTDSGMETAAVKAPERRGGRPALPRCEHDKIVGRCPKCVAA